MRISVDAEQCNGHGRCYTVSPEAYVPDDEGYARLGNPSSRTGQAGPPLLTFNYESETLRPDGEILASTMYIVAAVRSSAMAQAPGTMLHTGVGRPVVAAPVGDYRRERRGFKT